MNEVWRTGIAGSYVKGMVKEGGSVRNTLVLNFALRTNFTLFLGVVINQ